MQQSIAIAVRQSAEHGITEIAQKATAPCPVEENGSDDGLYALRALHQRDSCPPNVGWIDCNTYIGMPGRVGGILAPDRGLGSIVCGGFAF